MFNGDAGASSQTIRRKSTSSFPVGKGIAAIKVLDFISRKRKLIKNIWTRALN